MKKIKIGQIWKLNDDSDFNVVVTDTLHIKDGFVTVCVIVGSKKLGDNFDTVINSNDLINKFDTKSYRILRMTRSVILADNLLLYRNTLTKKAIAKAQKDITNTDFNYSENTKEIISFYCNRLYLHRQNALNKIDSLL